MFQVRAVLINSYLAAFDLALTVACYLALLRSQLGAESRASGLGSLLPSERILALGWVLGIWLVLLWNFGMYRSRRTETVFADLGTIAKVALTGLAILAVLAQFLPALQPTRFFLIEFAVLTLVAMGIARMGVRLILRELRRRGYNIKPLMLVTTPANAARLRQKIAERAHYGYSLVRHLQLNGRGPTAEARLLADFRQAIGTSRVEDVILALPTEARALVAQLIEDCEAQGINVRLVPDLFPLVEGETQVYNLDGIPLIDVHLYATESLGYAVLKRVFDIGMSLVILVALSPLFLLIAVLVKLTSPGPALFRQKRVGLNGKPFMMLKFRTMRIDASLDPERHWTTSDEPSITAIGRWLRRSNLDELPQFFNVLEGTMSIVGPRPERPHFIARFRKEIPNYMRRHYVKCGITGWAQVNGWRGDTSIRERLAHDLYYMQHWGLGLDAKILFWTVTRGFFHPNAY